MAFTVEPVTRIPSERPIAAVNLFLGGGTYSSADSPKVPSRAAALHEEEYMSVIAVSKVVSSEHVEIVIFLPVAVKLLTGGDVRCAYDTVTDVGTVG